MTRSKPLINSGHFYWHGDVWCISPHLAAQVKERTLMGRKIVELFGYVRTFVYVIVLAVFAGALSAVGIPPLGIVVVTAGFAVLLWKAPFGARYRKNF